MRELFRSEMLSALIEHTLAALEPDDELDELDEELDDEVEVALELGALLGGTGYRVVVQPCPHPGTVELSAEIEQSSWASRARLRFESGEANRSSGGVLVSGL